MKCMSRILNGHIVSGIMALLRPFIRLRPEPCKAGRHEGRDTQGGHLYAGQHAVRVRAKGGGTRGAGHQVRKCLCCRCRGPGEHEPGTKLTNISPFLSSGPLAGVFMHAVPLPCPTLLQYVACTSL